MTDDPAVVSHVWNGCGRQSYFKAVCDIDRYPGCVHATWNAFENVVELMGRCLLLDSRKSAPGAARIPSPWRPAALMCVCSGVKSLLAPQHFGHLTSMIITTINWRSHLQQELQAADSASPRQLPRTFALNQREHGKRRGNRYFPRLEIARLSTQCLSDNGPCPWENQILVWYFLGWKSNEIICFF